LRVIVLLVLLAAMHALGQVAAPDVSVSQLDAAVTRVTENLPEDDPQRVALLKSYADTRAALSSFDQFNEKLNSYSKARANAAQDAGKIEKKLAEQQQAPQAEAKLIPTMSRFELEQTILVDRSELDAKRNQLSDFSAAITGMPGRRVEIRNRMTELASLAADLASQLDQQSDKSGGSSTVGSVDEATWWRTGAQLASVNAEKAALEEELLSQPMRLALLKAQQDQTAYEVAQLEERSRLMTQRASELREGEAAAAQAAADLVLASTQGKHPLVRQLADSNAELSRTFSELNQQIQTTEAADIEVSGAAEQIETDLTSIERKLELLGMSTVVGEVLRERQAQLPAHNAIAKQISDNSAAIRASSLIQVELEEERRLLRNEGEYIKHLADGFSPEEVLEIKDDMNELIVSRRDLVRKAIELESTYAKTLGDLDFTLRRYVLAIDAYRDFISERLLWIPSRDKFGLFRGEEADLIEQIAEVFAPSRWMNVVGNMPSEVLVQPLAGVLLLVVLGLVYLGPRLKQQLVEVGKHVGYVRSDSFASTSQALALSLLVSVKWPLLLLTAAWLFEMQETESELATALYISCFRAAPYFWGLEFLRIALLPKGLVDTHFRWPASRVSLVRRRIIALEFTLLPSAMMVIFFINLYPRSVGGSLGTIAVILVLFSIAHFFHRLPEFVQSKMQMIFSDKVSSEDPIWSKLMRRLLFWIPTAAILAVLFGYTYTAIEVALLLIRTFFLLSCILILHELGLRWLSLTRRRMAYKVRQELGRNTGEDNHASIEDEILENDPELLNDEGTKFLNLVTLFAGLLGVAWIWAEVFPALGILDSFNLWSQTTVVDGREIVDPVTLGDLARALVFATMGLFALGRVPGLIEIMLRQRLKVAPASSYAVTRVIQYAATMLLVIIVVGTLGVSWSSLQWAVAALSLGIGFGLQEIVANFISGLIILFEQPIRLGDIVTVGDTSGTVTRIQMRATTIRDYDRRELLVPNKEFITGRLLNWTLSDSVTRRLIQVGVAYGTDMDQALDIVREAANKHSFVLADPQAQVTFDEFGDNSLLISLRYFLGNLDRPLGIDSELRLEINRRFNEAGIVVSFPQRDIHIDTTQPLEIKMMDSGRTQ
jgi:potassium-dependent mechanosensitive channel